MSPCAAHKPGGHSGLWRFVVHLPTTAPHAVIPSGEPESIVGAATFGRASAAEQEQVFSNVLAQGGQSNRSLMTGAEEGDYMKFISRRLATVVAGVVLVLAALVGSAAGAGAASAATTPVVYAAH